MLRHFVPEHHMASTFCKITSYINVNYRCNILYLDMIGLNFTFCVYINILLPVTAVICDAIILDLATNILQTC